MEYENLIKFDPKEHIKPEDVKFFLYLMFEDFNNKEQVKEDIDFLNENDYSKYLEEKNYIKMLFGKI